MLTYKILFVPLEILEIIQELIKSKIIKNDFDF